MQYNSAVQALNDWYDCHAQPYSWRSRHHPWPVWVAEIMLQQTRTATVERYYPLFMQLFPTPGALAAAPETHLMQVWKGLGYYRRARMLREGARYVADTLAGGYPDNLEDWLAVPGIGPYSARSISAIAYDAAHLPIDGNVARVHARLHRRRMAARQLPAREVALWEAALAQHGARRAVQALMEVGSTICLPRAPRCGLCPLRDHGCRSGVDPARAGRYGAAPIRKVAVTTPMVALAVESAGRWLMVQRPATGLLAGQWGLPVIAAQDERLARWPKAKRTGTETVAFSHRRWDCEVRLYPQASAALQRRAQALGGQWCAEPSAVIGSRAMETIWQCARRLAAS